MAKTKSTGFDKKPDKKVERPKRKKLKKKNEKKRRRSYNPASKDVIDALDALNSGDSFRKVSQQFCIPVGVLHRLKSATKTGIKRGPSTVLSQEEELEIVKWIIHRSSIGVPATTDELKDTVREYVKKIEKKIHLSTID